MEKDRDIINKLIENMFSGHPLVVVNKNNKKFIWIIPEKVIINNRGWVTIEDEIGEMFSIYDYDIYTIDEYNDMIRE